MSLESGSKWWLLVFYLISLKCKHCTPKITRLKERTDIPKYQIMVSVFFILLNTVCPPLCKATTSRLRMRCFFPDAVRLKHSSSQGINAAGMTATVDRCIAILHSRNNLLLGLLLWPIRARLQLGHRVYRLDFLFLSLRWLHTHNYILNGFALFFSIIWLPFDFIITVRYSGMII